jgi:hypothetical protein
MVDGKCREFVNETKRLVIEQVDRTLDVKIFAISLGDSKTFLAMHSLDDNGDGIVNLLNNEQLKQIQNKFLEMNSPNIHNLVVVFKHHASRGYIDNILELKSKSHYDYI